MDPAQVEGLALILAVGQIAAAIAVLNGLFTAFGQGKVAAQALEGISRQPEARGTLTSTMFVGMAIAETSAIYGLLIAIVLLFANPLVGIFISTVM